MNWILCISDRETGSSGLDRSQKREKERRDTSNGFATDCHRFAVAGQSSSVDVSCIISYKANETRMNVTFLLVFLPSHFDSSVRVGDESNCNTYSLV